MDHPGILGLIGGAMGTGQLLLDTVKLGINRLVGFNNAQQERHLLAIDDGCGHPDLIDNA